MLAARTRDRSGSGEWAQLVRLVKVGPKMGPMSRALAFSLSIRVLFSELCLSLAGVFVTPTRSRETEQAANGTPGWPLLNENLPTRKCECDFLFRVIYACARSQTWNKTI